MDHTVTAELERAWALACRLGDPCWEGMTARVLAVVSARRGDPIEAATWLDLARHRCEAVTDTYQWVKGYVLDASIGMALAADDDERASRLVGALASVAARGDMGELIVRAHLHQSRLGEPTALETARLLANNVDNPALHRTVDAAAGAGR